MREILFRAKRQNGEWGEGSLLFYPDVNRAFISSGDYSSVGGTVEVDKKTVGQFTGLTDKNGKRIFEGDVVRGMDHLNPYLSVSGYVSFADASFCIVDEYFSHYRWHDYELEVIGNIYDNPELLEVSGDE